MMTEGDSKKLFDAHFKRTAKLRYPATHCCDYCGFPCPDNRQFHLRCESLAANFDREWVFFCDDDDGLYDACSAMHNQNQGRAMLSWPRDELELWEARDG